MSYTISKELLNEVLKVDGHTISGGIDIDGVVREIAYSTPNEDGFSWDSHKINIYELAHKYKEWALKQGYWFETRIQLSGTYLTLRHDYMHIVDLTKNFNNADSEQQAVFDACQWILDNKVNEELQDD